MIPASSAAPRLLSAVLAGALVAIVLALSACGGESSAGADGTIAAATTEAAAPTDSKPQPAGNAAKACRAQLDGFLTAMERLREGLAVGYSYEQYVEEVEAIRQTYDRVPVVKLGVGCLLRSGTPGEEAFDRYIAAANDWGECIDESDCDSAEVEPVLQRKWKLAAHHLDRARDGLGPAS